MVVVLLKNAEYNLNIFSKNAITVAAIASFFQQTVLLLPILWFLNETKGIKIKNRLKQSILWHVTQAQKTKSVAPLANPYSVPAKTFLKTATLRECTVAIAEGNPLASMQSN